MIPLLAILALTSSCNIVGQLEFCTSTSTMTSTNCGLSFAIPPYSCSSTVMTSLSTNQTKLADPPPQWVVDISNQINTINALGWSPSGWFEVVGLSKLISIPAYFAIRAVKKLPRFKDSIWMSYTTIGAVTVLAGLIGFFGLPSLAFFSVMLGGSWIVSYPYLGKFQRSSSE